MDAQQWLDAAPDSQEGVIPPSPFTFPQRFDDDNASSHRHRRTTSMGVGLAAHERVASLERKSASALPTFSFNATDTSGRSDEPALQPVFDTPTSTGKGGYGHRRGASEYIGGTPRGGMPSLVNTSPTKRLDLPGDGLNDLSAGSPVRKRGHAHRRSTAVSMHDVQSILQPRDANILPVQSEPFAFPKPQQSAEVPEPQLTPDHTPEPSVQAIPRPRVGFSSNIEFIPRPLSTISSETESTISAVGPASSLNTSPLRSPQPSSPGKRKSASGRSSLSEVESMSATNTRNTELDGDDALNSTAVSTTDLTVSDRPSSGHQDFIFPPRKKAMNLDRRKSEPLLSLMAPPKARQSSISLREPLESPISGPVVPILPFEPPVITRKSSASRVKAWASSVVSRKDRKRSKQRLTPDPDSAPESAITSTAVTPMSEPDLEELFTHDPFSQDDNDQAPASVFSFNDMNNLRDFRPTFDTSVESGPVIDLDAAMEPSKTPSKSPGFGARRQLHSSRTNRDFNGPAGLFHRRAESAPVLPSFDYPKSPSPQQSPMADVFDEEEEDEYNAKEATPEQDTPTPSSAQPTNFADETSERAVSRDSTDDGLGIRHTTSLPPTPSGDEARCGPSVADDTIMEEYDNVEIVEDHEEPRASMITKSSDSSETPTLMAETFLDPIITNLAPPQAAFMAPSVYTESTVSTPDTNRRQGSFDTTRIGTSASSTTDCRTVSSLASGSHDPRKSVDDVPSLISSRSTTVNSRHPRIRRGASGMSMASSYNKPAPEPAQEDAAEQKRRKRSSIASLSNLLSSPFAESKSRLGMEQHNSSTPNLLTQTRSAGRKKEHRLSKLMFWKHKGNSRPSTSSNS